MPGALTESNRTETRKSLTSGVEGVQRLCKAMLSAKFIGDVMIGWGEDLVSFLPWPKFLFFRVDWVNCGRGLVKKSRFCFTYSKSSDNSKHNWFEFVPLDLLPL